MWYLYERIFNLKLCKDFVYFYINFMWDLYEKIFINFVLYDFYVKFKFLYEVYVDFMLNFSLYDLCEV